jgi:mono/diheme cytochrome c family protein
MTKLLWVAIPLLVLNTACGREAEPPPQAFQPNFSFLTTGDASQGRQAFADLKCFTCHRVMGDAEFSSPMLSGPDLGSLQAGLAANQIADSIVAPAHDNGESSMGDYSKIVTVRQLTDLIAYIHTLP